jgi:DNA-binding MarR family transcriptional regulator
MTIMEKIVPHPFSEPDERIEHLREHLRRHLCGLTGRTDLSGVEIANWVRRIATQYDTLGAPELSGPRWGLLMRLLVEEELGNAGVTPTYLSRCQNVSKNTISALLRGLEEHGLVDRQLDAADRRIFRIQLTPAGRALALKTGPERAHMLNRMVSGLEPEERQQLLGLLEKLHRCMLAITTPEEVS